jgi:hypothetical protein
MKQIDGEELSRRWCMLGLGRANGCRGFYPLTSSSIAQATQPSPAQPARPPAVACTMSAAVMGPPREGQQEVSLSRAPLRRKICNRGSSRRGQSENDLMAAWFSRPQSVAVTRAQSSRGSTRRQQG